jgi:hypothetical protein
MLRCKELRLKPASERQRPRNMFFGNTTVTPPVSWNCA